MRIIGVDPGSRITGYGVLDVDRRGKLNPVTFDTIRVKPTAALHTRLLAIFEGMSEVLRQFQPEVMAVEEVFFARDARGALALGQARGVVLLAGASFGCSVVPYSATFVKQAVSGSGHADKLQVQRMVTSILCLGEAPFSDAADALALAICHANSYRMKQYDRLVVRKAPTPGL